MMFGAYQTVSPYAGCDAGLVYYIDKGAWKLFLNPGDPDEWQESDDHPGTPADEDNLIKKSEYVNGKVYLQMKLVNGYVQIIVRKPANWKILDDISYYLNGSFTTNPSNIELTREVALAQSQRHMDGSVMDNAHWSQVYYYKLNSSAVLSTYDVLQSSHPSRLQYSSSLPYYLTGDTAADKSCITVYNSPLYKYYEEVAKIKY